MMTRDSEGEVLAALRQIAASAQVAARALGGVEDAGAETTAARQAREVATGQVTLGTLRAMALAADGQVPYSAVLGDIIGQMDAVKHPRAVARLTGVRQLAGAYETIAGGTTTNPTEGALTGALAGGEAGATLATTVLGLGGPAGWVAGAALGAILGAGAARKRAEDAAQRVREQQLQELRRIGNSLRPVADYFHRGAFTPLAPTRAFTTDSERAWAVAQRRGMRG